MKRDSVIRIDNDDDNIARDGETVSVRVNLTDTVRFDGAGREHFVRNEAARDARTRKAKPPDDDDDGDNDDTIGAADHRPGFRYAARDARAVVRDARDEMIRRAEGAWRTPQHPRRTVRSTDSAEPDLGSSPEAMRRHMYGAPGLPAASDPDVDSAMTMRGHMGELFERSPMGELFVRSQRARDRAWGSYRDQLSNAWRGGRTDPRRAAQEESRLERWKAPSE
jgi:hypothetical protein